LRWPSPTDSDDKGSEPGRMSGMGSNPPRRSRTKGQVAIYRTTDKSVADIAENSICLVPRHRGRGWWVPSFSAVRSQDVSETALVGLGISRYKPAARRHW